MDKRNFLKIRFKFRPTIRLRTLLLLLTAGAAENLWADLSQPGAITRELQQQDQRQQVMGEQRRPGTPDVRLRSAPDRLPEQFPRESPCFLIRQVELQGAEAELRQLLQPLAGQAEGMCLGLEGIRLLMRRMQNRLVEEGYVTTRVLAPAQDLAPGVLRLRIVAGRVGRIRGRQGSRRDLAGIIPLRSGDLLDLRALEQGLENLRRLPGSRADVRLVPGERSGESDLQVSWQQQKPWRFSLALDDTGSEQTGKRQAAATLFLDNPLGKGDLFYISRGRDLLNGDPGGSDSLQLHYSLPRGYWLFSLNAARYDYYQTVSSGVVDYRYRGEGESIQLGLERVLYRGMHARTSLGFELGRRASSNFIDDIEIELQHRRTAYGQFTLRHRQYLERATLDLALTYRTGLKVLDAEPAPEERSGGASAREALWRVGVDLQLPFKAAGRRFRYHGALRGQIARGELTPPERFSIGNRWTVRGFDGQASLVADSGWYLRNELVWPLSQQRARLFAGLDLGRVSGGGSELLPGQSLAGAVVGIRGEMERLQYEVFAALPLNKPARFESDSSTFGFSLNWQW